MTGCGGAVERACETIGLGWALGMALFSMASFVLYLAGAPAAADVAGALAAAVLGEGAVLLVLRRARRCSEPGARRLRGVMPEVRGSGTAGDALAAHAGAMSLDSSDSEDRAAGIVSPALVAAGLGLAALQVGLAARLALQSAMRDYDAWLVWGFKARLFADGTLTRVYFHQLGWPMHPDYPLNFPLAESLFLRLPDPPGAQLAALVGVACLAALLLLFYAGLTRLYGRELAALATAALALVPQVWRWAGSSYADVPLALYLGGAALYLLLWWRRRRTVDLLLMGLLAGGAVWTKKEGLPVAALLVVACVVGEMVRRDAAPARRLARAGAVVGAALVLPLPWLIFARVVQPIGADFLPVTLGNFAAHADRLPTIAWLFVQEAVFVAHWSLFWIVLAVVAALAARRLSGSGRALLLLLVAQIAIYLLGYVFSNWLSYTWHVHTSLDRLMVQACPLAVLVMAECVHALGRHAAPERTPMATIPPIRPTHVGRE